MMLAWPCTFRSRTQKSIESVEAQQEFHFPIGGMFIFSGCSPHHKTKLPNLRLYSLVVSLTFCAVFKGRYGWE
jgi:hypothetical protein